jgi:hypothetical protein
MKNEGSDVHASQVTDKDEELRIPYGQRSIEISESLTEESQD